MIGSERFLFDHQRPFVQRLGVGITRLKSIHRSFRREQRLNDIAMIRSERFLFERQQSLVPQFSVGIAILRLIKQFGVGVPTLRFVKTREIVQ